MLTFVPSKDESTIAVEFSGKATEEDAKKLDNYADQNFNDEEKFNLFMIMHDVDGSSFKGLIKGMKTDAKHWKQYNKVAVISDKKSVQKAGDLGDYLPGIETKHFEKDEQEDAWSWVKE